MSQCESFGLLPNEAASEVLAVIEVVSAWQEHFEQAGVSGHDIMSLAERIDGEELLTQRTQFDASRLQGVPRKKARKRPFLNS